MKTEVLLTLNGAPAIKVLEILKARGSEVREELNKIDLSSDMRKKLESELKAISQVEAQFVDDVEKLSASMNNLSSMSEKQIRRQIGVYSKARANLTGSEEDLRRGEQMRELLRAYNDELRKRSGIYVDISKGASNLADQTDRWLDKAISQQRELLKDIKPTTAEYREQEEILSRLQAEQDRRSVKVDKTSFVPSEADYNKAKSIAGGNVQQPDNTSRTPTKKDLQWSKDYLQQELNNTQTSDVAKIESIKRAIAQVDEQMKVYASTTEKAVMSEERLADVLNNINTSSLDDLREASATLKKKMDSLAPSSDEAKQIKAQLVALDKEIKQVEVDIVNVDDVLSRSRKGKASVDELRKAYKQLQTELAGINTGSERFRQGSKELEELRKKIEQVTGAANKQTSAWQTAARNLTAYVGLFAMFNKAKELITDVIHKNLEYSSSLTDIRKVSGLAMEDVEKLSTELAKIDTRTSVDGLAQLAYQGAKLGMGQYGVEGMAGFVRAADKINVAIGEEMGEDALPALAKMVETMGLIPRMGIEKALDATGSAMFKLSSTSTATSGNIVEFAKRLTGISRTAGITTDQLLALGSASDSMFLMPEVSATAMSKFIVALQKNHNLIEQDLGIQQGTIKNMYAAGNAMDAIVLVLEKMRDKGNMNALGNIFGDLGGDGQRLISAMVTMSKNIDTLKDHLHESKEAFDEASAVTAEYEMQQTSAIGILERANNLWEKAFINPDGVEQVKMMTQAWYDISQTILQSPLYKGTLTAALSALVVAVKALVYMVPLLINYFVAFGAVKAAQMVWGIVRAVQAATIAQVAYNAALKLNPWTALASVLMTVAGVVWSYVSAANEAAKAQAEAAKKANEWKNHANEAQQETDTLVRKLSSYKTAMESLNLSQEERNRQLRQFNSDFRQYISKLGIEIKSVSDLKKHYKELSEEIQRATYYRMWQKAREDVMPSYQKDRLDAANRIKTALGGAFDGWTQQGVMEAFGKGYTSTGVYQNMIKSRLTKESAETVQFDHDKYFYTDQYGQTHKGAETELFSALTHYYNATKREQKKEKEVFDYYNAITPIEGYHPWVDDDLGTLDNDATKGRGGKKTGGGNAAKKEESAAKTRANALIANIKAFYEEQQRKYLEWVAQMNADGEKISEGQQNVMLAQIETRMNTALGTARQSIADLKGGWQDFYKSMGDDVMVASDETSRALLDSIGKANVEELHKLFSKLSGDLSKENHKTLSENLGALLDQIFANGSAELKKAAQKLLAQQREIQKIISTNDYTGSVNRETRSNFDTLGFLKPAKGVKADTPEGLTAMNSAFDRLTEKARNSVAALYDLNPAADDFREEFLQYLSVASDGFDFALLNGQELKALYIELIKYTDNYTEAEKKTYDNAKKITDQMWAVNKRNLDSQRALTDLQTEGSMYGTQTNFGSTLGVKDNTYDPEIEAMRLKMQMAEDYYAFLLQNTKNKQLLADADKSRQEAELNYANQMATAMKSRLSQMQSLVNPIVDFGEAMGEAFATMATDADSANKAIKNALKSMLQSWGKMLVNDVNSQMWQKINAAGVWDRQKKAQPEIQSARASAAQGASQDAAAKAATRSAATAASGSVPLSQAQVASLSAAFSNEYAAKRETAGAVVLNQPAAPVPPTATAAASQTQQATPAVAAVPAMTIAPAPAATASVSSAAAPATVASAGAPNASATAGAVAADPFAALGSSANPAYVYVVNGQQGGVPGAEGASASGAPTANATSAAPGVANTAAASGAPGAAGTAQGGNALAPGASAAVQGAAGVAGAVGSAAANVASGGGTWSGLGASAAGAMGNALLNTAFIGGDKKKKSDDAGGGTDKATAKARKKEIKEAKKQQKELTNVSEKGTKERTQVSEQGISDITAATEEGGKEQSLATQTYQAASSAIIESTLNTNLINQQAAAKQETQTEASKQQAKMPMSIAGAVGQCFSSLGPIAGPIMAATVTATLTALLQWALNSAFGSSSDSSTTTSTPNTKLSTGMLTYDSGNVQDLKPYVGDNGELYWAKEETAPQSGVNLLTQPTATKINGQNALVAENGPELVIGRETTKAMMMNNPALMKALVQYDANYSGRRAFDRGNVSEALGAYAVGVQQDNSSAAANDALLQAVNALVQRLNQPINAQINMYGRGNLYDSMTKANQFMSGKG